MRRTVFLSALALVVITALVAWSQSSKTASEPAWSFNASTIEACSCPMFCQCYFNDKPASQSGHEGMSGMAEHYCRFNNAYMVNKGNYGNVKLDGVKFWLGGDLGGDFSQGKMDWAELTFDPSVTKEQRDGVSKILGYLFPVKWNSFKVVNDAPIEWKATKDEATAKLAEGKSAEVELQRFQGMSNDPVVIKNLKYWGAPRNDGFIMMPNKVEAYRTGDKPFEFTGTNGFMITIDMNSKDFSK